ncbi:homoserine dehydrogenase [Maridesulfovibrio zosterae]|uniref:homoserine dehydrogenase n=1 Tax=Maridesulfovibrio zosterae TaxID=82171 RepID=UPI000429310E|nr:homoserine dehydrogenase [Maridesulfovibrio zosterae]
MQTVKLAIAGFGTVGTGLARIIEENKDVILARCGKNFKLTSVLVRDINKKRDFLPGPEVKFTADPDEFTSNPDVDIVVELMGGITVAKEIVIKALKAGKHVVTANKHLLAVHGIELFRVAAENKVGLYYEASVAGGIPIIQSIKESLAANRIKSIVGILNGTANYILSEMSTNGLEFDTALNQAKELGYAEADPTFDIEGIDAAHKVVVLARIAYGQDYPLDELPIEGITKVEGQDIRFAREFGYRIKLIGQVRDVGGKLEAGVFPALVKYTLLLARVGGNYNAIRVEGNAVGPAFFHGQGAGSLPTGSAVLADIMALSKTDTPDNTGFCNAPIKKAEILSPELATSEYYFRFTVQDKAGVMAALSKCLAEYNISIAQAVQKGNPSEKDIPVVFTTHQASTKDVNAALKEIDNMPFITRQTVSLRILKG